MSVLLNLVIDLLAGVVNVAAIRWPETATLGTLPESDLERRVSRNRKFAGTAFFLALVLIPLALMGWILS